jgi:hypothetical protein
LRPGIRHAIRGGVLSLVSRLLALMVALFLAACASRDRVHKMVVSVPDQKMALYKRGELVKVYDVSTSKFCLSTRPGTNGTPLGEHEVAKKIGDGQPVGMKFKSRRPTGEVVPVNAPGRDPIVTRILWLKGLESANRTSFSRTIYIHGTPEESKIGRPASYGCVRMRSKDILDLYNKIGMGATVDIVNQNLELPPTVVPPAQPVGAGQVAQVAQMAHPVAHPVGHSKKTAAAVRKM